MADSLMYIKTGKIKLKPNQLRNNGTISKIAPLIVVQEIYMSLLTQILFGQPNPQIPDEFVRETSAKYVAHLCQRFYHPSPFKVHL